MEAMAMGAEQGSPSPHDETGRETKRAVSRAASPIWSAPQRVCNACGASARLAETMSYVCRGDAWFCAYCWRQLPAEEIVRVVREVVLRGVPLS